MLGFVHFALRLIICQHVHDFLGSEKLFINHINRGIFEELEMKT